MSEIFDIIIAVNRLKDQVRELNSKIDYLCKYPSLIAFEKNVDQPTACKLLHISPRTIFRMRLKGKISFSRDKGRILYPIAEINKYLSKNQHGP